MAYYPYALISIIYISYYQFIQTFAAIVDIEGSSYKLSTDIEYAIYEPGVNDYLKDNNTGNTCQYDLFNYNLAAADLSVKNPKARWKIEETAHGYAIKNVGTNRYLSRLCNSPDTNNVRRFSSAEIAAFQAAGLNAALFASLYVSADVGTQPIASPHDESGLSWKFNAHNRGSYTYKSQSIPRVVIEASDADWKDLSFENCLIKWTFPHRIWQFPSPDLGCTAPSEWVFLPLSLPSNCKITTNFSEPDKFKSLTQQIDGVQSIKFPNTDSKEKTIPTPSKTYCKTYTTSFTRTEGSEMSYGFKIAYQQPQVSAGPVSVGGGFSGEYHMDWTRNSETENTNTQEDETCIEFPSTEIICPARTTCTRDVLTYKPSVSNVEVTVNAVCDGIEYTTTGTANVDGIVRMEYKDEFIPMDCPYYTTDYNKFESGTLQFCDTCNNDQTCDICRDGYILLDGVCIAESTCESLCGGKVRGGDIIDVSGGAGPWSGGWCHINDYNKYLSDSCRGQLNNATPTQTAPDSNDGPSNGEECVNMYGQCGGIGFNGLTNCCQNENDEREWRCIKIDETRSQCNPLPN